MGARVIEARGLSKDYGTFRAVDSLDLGVNQGEIYGFLGRNGAGKTTTIRMLLGLVAPTSGGVFLFGSTRSGISSQALARTGCLVETATAYPNLTVGENLEVHRRLRGAPRRSTVEVIERLGLGEFVHRRADRLSLGNKQRLALARALLGDPDLLVLDEPVNGLDPAGIVEVRDLLRSLCERGTTILLSSHLLDEVAQVAHRLGILHRGRLVEEFQARDLEALSQRRGHGVEVEVDQARGAEVLRSQGYGVDVQGLTLRVTGAQPAAVAQVLVEAGVGVHRLVPWGETLEERFLRLTSEEEQR